MTEPVRTPMRSRRLREFVPQGEIAPSCVAMGFSGCQDRALLAISSRGTDFDQPGIRHDMSSRIRGSYADQHATCGSVTTHVLLLRAVGNPA